VCEVITDPSVEASFPTMIEVHADAAGPQPTTAAAAASKQTPSARTVRIEILLREM
jgi:hypothetical protein